MSNEYEISDAGKIVEDKIRQISERYENVCLNCFVVMPNHVHMILTLKENYGRQVAAPTLSQIIQNLKRAVSMDIKFSPWQKSFHDHIIRDEKSFLEIAEYVRTNPENWESDMFYAR